MPIVCIGISHRTAPVALRERLAFSADQQRRVFFGDAAGRLAAEHGLGELVILSTCNRTEIYAAASDVSHRLGEVPEALMDLLVEGRAVSRDRLLEHVYAYRGIEAVRHLCRVAAGLDSMVLGESEILGQVTRGHETAAREGAAGPMLEAAFRAAVRAGRRARVETGICRNPMSVSSEAVRLIRDAAGDLSRQRVLVIGTGKMGRLAGEALRAHGATDLRVVSRTAQHAEALAQAWAATPLAWHELAAAIREADVVISSTGAPHAVITTELVASALAGAEPRPRLFVDIAVPRDIEPEVGRLPQVRLFDLDHLQTRIDGSLVGRQREVPRVEAIVGEEVARFEEWRRGAELRPLLSALRARSEAIRRSELERIFRRLGDISPELREQIERFSVSLVNQLLHEPTRRLRAAGTGADGEAYASVTRDLFGLSEVEVTDEPDLARAPAVRA